MFVLVGSQGLSIRPKGHTYSRPCSSNINHELPTTHKRREKMEAQKDKKKKKKEPEKREKKSPHLVSCRVDVASRRKCQQRETPKHMDGDTELAM